MRITSSLTNRIFLAWTLVAALSLGFALYVVNARATQEAEADLVRGLDEAGTLVEENREELTNTVTRLARLVADLPKLKAAVETGDPPTVQPLGEEYRGQIGADLLLVTGRQGQPLATAGPTPSDLTVPTGLTPGSDEELATFASSPNGVLQVVSEPILLAGTPPDVLGRLTVGFYLDDGFAERIKRLTGSEIALGSGNSVLASTLPPEWNAPLTGVMQSAGPATVRIAGDEYLVRSRPLVPGTQPNAVAPVVMTLRSRSERLRLLGTIRAGLEGAFVVALLLATIVSYAVARTVTRPISAITSAMRDVAATGDLTRKVAIRSGPWDDEDARLLASSFNTLTESVARFQAEAAQRERLSSLGRLSTVIAHEVRNPLMIIKAALRTLRRDDVRAADLREAVADIDEETTRLNRVVTEVLDFAKPIRFDFAEADLNDICRASASAAWVGEPHRVALDLDGTLPNLVTDAERLRTALVNILTNARHAVDAVDAARPPDDPATPAVVVRTCVDPDAHLTVAIRDRGMGIAREDLARIFDPYFTTRRAGTGLGLPISKNIIEGLGGRLVVDSERGVGTEVRIHLPLIPPEARA